MYAITNQKGGVGKTTTAVNVAACIAEAGYPTILVDVDPQANATVGLGLPKFGEPSVYDVLVGRVGAIEALRPTDVENLRILPAHPDLAASSVELPREPGSETRLAHALAPLRDEAAYIILDCPPSLGPLTINALVAADRVIVPVQTEYFALEGLAGLLDTLALVQRELNPRLGVAGNRTSTKLQALCGTSRPSAMSFSRVHSRQVALWARALAMKATSSSAATPAASAGAETLNGPRIRLSASITDAGP